MSTIKPPSREPEGDTPAAARELGENSPVLKDPLGSLLPAVHDIRTVAVKIATAVGLEAQQSGLAPRTGEEELRDLIAASQWTPAYSQPTPGSP